jgi:hypothetical protein
MLHRSSATTAGGGIGCWRDADYVRACPCQWPATSLACLTPGREDGAGCQRGGCSWRCQCQSLASARSPRTACHSPVTGPGAHGAASRLLSIAINLPWSERIHNFQTLTWRCPHRRGDGPGTGRRRALRVGQAQPNPGCSQSSVTGRNARTRSWHPRNGAQLLCAARFPRPCRCRLHSSLCRESYEPLRVSSQVAHSHSAPVALIFAAARRVAVNQSSPRRPI